MSETKAELKYGETTHVEDLMECHGKALEVINAFNELARRSGIAGNLYELKVNKRFWNALLAQGRKLDRADMVSTLRLAAAPTKSIQ